MATTYRILPNAEWDKLRPLFANGELSMPNPDLSIASVAENAAGVIVGVVFIQLAAHMEPLIITDPRVNFLKMQAVLNEQFLRMGNDGLVYYAMTDNAHTARMAELAGMWKTEYTLYRGKIQVPEDQEDVA